MMAAVSCELGLGEMPAECPLRRVRSHAARRLRGEHWISNDRCFSAFFDAGAGGLRGAAARAGDADGFTGASCGLSFGAAFGGSRLCVHGSVLVRDGVLGCFRHRRRGMPVELARSMRGDIGLRSLWPRRACNVRRWRMPSCDLWSRVRRGGYVWHRMRCRSMRRKIARRRGDVWRHMRCRRREMRCGGCYARRGCSEMRGWCRHMRSGRREMRRWRGHVWRGRRMRHRRCAAAGMWMARLGRCDGNDAEDRKRSHCCADRIPRHRCNSAKFLLEL